MGAAENKPLRALIVEDSEFDARLLVTLLRQGGYEPAWQRVQTGEAMKQALEGKGWDIVFSDHEMPQFNASKALEILQGTGHDLPFIIVSGGIGEATAVALMKAGAHDFLIKGQLGRLIPAVQRELREAANRHARRSAEDSLRDSEQRYRLLWQKSPDAILMMSPSGVIVFANPAASDVFGYPEAELLGLNFTDLLDSGHASAIQLPWQEEVPSDHRPMLELTGRTKAATELVVEIGFSDLIVKDHRWRVAFIRDITQRRLAETALRKKEDEFRMAREIQQRLFPKVSPQISGLDIAGASSPADEAGGDYYDYLTMADGSAAVVVADVSGHGMGPALIMAETRAYLHILALHRTEPGEVLTRANRVLADDLGDGSKFVTALFVRFDPLRRVLSHANAGHPAGLVVDEQGQVRVTLGNPCPPLGFLPESVYPSEVEVPLATGDTVVLLTDGITEAEGSDGTEFGTDRVVDVVRRTPDQRARQVVDGILAAVSAFTGNRPQSDDRTLVVIKIR